MTLAPSSETNPLRAGLLLERTPDPCVMVIFGATGDLAHRKLIPSLYRLARENFLPPGFSVVAYARRPHATEAYRQELRETVEKQGMRLEAAVWDSFAEGIVYHQASYDDPQGYEGLVRLLADLDARRGTSGNRIFYLATPPSAYPDIIRGLGESCVTRKGAIEESWSRIIVEKPFGRDLASARELNRQLLEVFREDQIYRIDHYLGKETVQNILAFRFANGIFEPLWNQHFVDHVQIAVAESIGIEGRGSYYEEAGALRDMVQNHMLQLLTLVAMEPPAAFDANAVRDEKVKVLRSIRPIAPSEVGEYVVRGQYGPGSIAGQWVRGYREEPAVAPDSKAETFVALKLMVENWRWAGVPFYLRTGKRLPKRSTEIAIQFNCAPHLLFGNGASEPLEPNVLVLRIQPDEGIALRFAAKVPGPAMRLRTVNMDFLYGTSFGADFHEAYERLLLDCLLGDSTLFTRGDEVEAAWALITPILQGWTEALPPAFPNYAAGAWGPREAKFFIERDGRRWMRL